MLIFVYGTLRKGACNSADKFVGAEYVDSDQIEGALYDLGWYPGFKRYLDEDGWVQGDVFRVAPEQLERLDAYEGAPDLYRRIRVETEGGYEVFVYEYNGYPDSDKLIPRGNWIEYERNRHKEKS